ncbi:MAG: DNA polymerase/3'-5' exonuclease PolX [Bacteroidota bacterium]
MHDRKSVAAVLEEMGTLLEIQGALAFKARAFHRASRSVEGITADLRTLAREGRLRELAGVGEGIARVITELLLEGRSREHEELRAALPPGVLEMLRIPGLGPRKVAALHRELRIGTLEDLEEAALSHRLARLKGFGEKTERNILEGIGLLRKRKDRYLYAEAAATAGSVHAFLMEQPGVVRADLAGSLRRSWETVGDIDVVVSVEGRHRARLVRQLLSHPEVASVLAGGTTRVRCRLHSGIQCDVRFVREEEHPFALNYFTGSKEHNLELWSLARSLGFSLNEYGLRRASGSSGKSRQAGPPVCESEADLYRVLGLDYIPPELREHMGEVEAARHHRLPRLVEWSDIRGTFHCHTTWSDGLHSVEEMALAARALGWEYLGIADHSRAASYAGGLSEERLREQGGEIERVNRAMPGFRVFRGTECDILPDGSLDWPERVRAGLDFVVVSVHSGFRMSEAAMTRRIITALGQKHVTMLGHPTGRLLLEREGYPVDVRAVIDAAAEYGRMIEINAHPTRLDLDWRWCGYAREKGVLLAINPDAHTTAGLADVRLGVGVARKGWLEKVHILNTQGAEGAAGLLRRAAEGSRGG